MSDLIDSLRREQKTYADLQSEFRTKIANQGRQPTPGEQKIIDGFHQREVDMRAHADYLEQKDARDRQPVYRHSMTGVPDAPKGGLVPGTVDGKATGPVPDGCYSQPLDHKQSVREAVGGGHLTEEACLGALGHLVKAQAVPVDPRETEQWSRAIGAKDMLSTGSAGVLVPTPLAGYIIDLMRNAVVVSRLGARTVPMVSKTVAIPRLTGDVTAAWLQEGATLTLSDATLDSVTLTAKRLDAGTKVSMELEEDSDPVAIGQVVSNSIANAFALKLDAAALRGSGVDPEPLGVRFTSGVTLYAPGTNGDVASWDVFLSLLRSVLAANVTPTGLITTPNSAITLAGLKQATTNAYLDAPPYIADAIANGRLQYAQTNALPSNLTKGTGTALTEWYAGDFRQLLIGLRTGMSIQVARELYRAEGKIGLFGRMRAAIGVEHPAAFAVATFVDD